MTKVQIYTDGSARGNPDGPGGYGAVLHFTDQKGVLHERELSAGYVRTTNNRMELMAEDIATINMTAGTVSGGGTAVGGAAAVLIFKNTVLAEIGTNGRITAANLNLTANTVRNITSYVAAGSAGVGAVSGSVLVILVGSKQSDDAKTAMTGKNGNNVSSNSQKSIDGALINASS